MKRLGLYRGTALVALWVLVVPVAVVAVVASNLVGTASFGWIYAVLVFGVVVLATSALVRGTRHARVWVAAAVALASPLTGFITMLSKPSLERVKQEASTIPAPPHSVLIGTDTHGNDACFDRCTQHWLYYAVPSATESVGWLNDWASAHGWSRATLDEGGRDAGWCQDGFSLLAVRGAPSDNPFHRKQEAPPGTDRVLVRVGAACR